MSTPQVDEARAQVITNLQNIFLAIDVEKKGHVPDSAFPTVLAKAGFGDFSEKLVKNMVAIVDPTGTDTIQFGIFVWLYDTLTFARTLFHAKAHNSTVDAAELGGVLTALHYPLDERTLKAVRTLTTSQQSFTYEQLVSTIVFLRFAYNTFAIADTNKNGKLDLKALETVLPVVGLEYNHDQASKLFGDIDLDKSGTIEPNEFLCFVIHLRFPNIQV